MREVIPLIKLLNKIKGSVNISEDSLPEFRCTVFEDKNGCIELEKCPRLSPRTNNMAINYHHVSNKAEEGLLITLGIDTKNQQAGLLTKNLANEQVLTLRNLICGW